MKNQELINEVSEMLVKTIEVNGITKHNVVWIYEWVKRIEEELNK